MFGARKENPEKASAPIGIDFDDDERKAPESVLPGLDCEQSTARGSSNGRTKRTCERTRTWQGDGIHNTMEEPENAEVSPTVGRKISSFGRKLTANTR